MCEKTPKIDTIDSHAMDTTARHIQEVTNSIDVADNSAIVAKAMKAPVGIPIQTPVIGDASHIEKQAAKGPVPHVVKSDWFWYTIQKVRTQSFN